MLLNELLKEEEAPLIAGLHHAGFLCAAEPRVCDAFWTQILGLRRVKQTVDSDCPDSYLLYYGNESGAAGTLISTLFLPQRAAANDNKANSGGQNRAAQNPAGGAERTAGQHSAVFSVRAGALPFWQRHLRAHGIACRLQTIFGQAHLCFGGPCGARLELVENRQEKRRPWAAVIAADKAICGLHSLSLAVHDIKTAADLLILLGYAQIGRENGRLRFALAKGNGANIVDIEQGAKPKTAAAARKIYAQPGALSHFAFALAAEQDLPQLREFLLDKGYPIGGLIDNIYFVSFYFHAPQGPVVEIAADGSGFGKDETPNSLGSCLQLPKSREHLRSFILRQLKPLAA